MSTSPPRVKAPSFPIRPMAGPYIKSWPEHVWVKDTGRYIASDDGIWWLIPDYIPDGWCDRLVVVYDDKGTHWLWTGWNNGEGHGKFKEGGKAKYTHRTVVEIVEGRKLKTLDYVDHLCERKACCTYECLEPTTPGINVARGPGRHTQYRPKEKLPEIPF